MLKLNTKENPQELNIEIQTTSEQVSQVTPDLVAKSFAQLSQKDLESILKKNRILLKVFSDPNNKRSEIDLLPSIVESLKPNRN